MKESTTSSVDSWPHRLAVLLCCATFPLIWVGGLVTTYDAGMAVPDWPSTYGYNLFLYPWTTWVFGPWDLLIEHGHRLLGALVGLITIAFLVAVWRRDGRGWMRGLAIGALVLVLLQGLLGGARVLLDERQLAMVHGCLGPAFFAYCVGISFCVSARWRQKPAKIAGDDAARLQRVAVITSLLAYLQLILGAQLRHIPVMASPLAFRVVVWFHLLIALVLAGHIVWLASYVFRERQALRELKGPASLLLSLLVCQFGLGAATWVLKYGWPAWFSDLTFAAHHTVQANSMVQATVVTGHVAVGSLILATSVLVSVRSFRLLRAEVAAVGSGTLLMGVAS